MVVHFYEIRNCTCANVDNRPVLVAPEDLLLDLLTYYEFVLLEDGRWVHFLNAEEYAHVMTGYPDHDVVFRHPDAPPPVRQPTPEETANGNQPAAIGIGLTCAGTILTVVFLFGNLLLPLVLPCGMQIAAFVLMIYTRIRYPDNRLGNILKWILIVEVILTVLSAIAVVISCVAACDSCIRSCPD
jgi:hypothetical protein